MVMLENCCGRLQCKARDSVYHIYREPREMMTKAYQRYMGKMDVCESFRYKLTTNETTAEGKVALRAVTMATMSRKMKTLRGLSKEKAWYCTNHHWPTFSEVRH